MSNLSHPNVMKMIGVCVDGNNTPYLVMPYMSQGSLLSFLRKNREELTAVDQPQDTVSRNLTSIMLVKENDAMKEPFVYSGAEYKEKASVSVFTDSKRDGLPGW